MKLFFYIAVFACFCAAGYFIWRGYRQRKVFFDNLLSFCNHLLIEISFSKNTVLHVMESYGNSYAAQFRQLLLSYKNLIDEKQDITRERINGIMWKKLKPHERVPITDFFFELGRHGSSEEGEKIENKKVIFDSFHQTAAERLKKEASIYLKLFILLGVGVVILCL